MFSRLLTSLAIPPAVIRASDYPSPSCTPQNTKRFQLSRPARDPPDMAVGLSTLDKPLGLNSILKSAS